MKRFLVLLFGYFVFHPGILCSQTKIIPYHELPDYNGNLTGSGMYFGASMDNSTITVTFEGPSDRWIAFGFGTNMQPTDVFIYSIGHAMSTHTLGWFDYNNSSYNNSGVLVDATQNWSVISTNTTSAGTRTVVATRSLNTGDASDVVLSFTSTALSLVWARGSAANYTISYHGGTNRANGITLPWLSMPTASFTANSQTICAGSSVTFSNLSTGGLTSYNWAFQGGSPSTSTSTNPVVSYTLPGTYSVVLTASNAIGTNTLSQLNYITVNPTVVPTISIGLSAGSNPLCAGSPVSFTSAIANGGSSPSYQWKINGINNGNTGSGFSSSSLADNDHVSCQLVSNQACINPSTAISPAITMTVQSTAPSSLSISQHIGSNPLCIGAVAGFSASPFHGGTTPSYQWKVNGNNAGSNSATFTTSLLSSGDIITCELSSNDPCTSSSIALSSGITITVSTLLVPSVSIGLSNPGATLCSGSTISFISSASNGGPAPSFQWLVNGVNSGSNSSAFSSNTLNNNDAVSCILTSDLSCASPQTATSSTLTLSINPTPSSPSISASGSPTLCPGDSLVLTSSLANTIQWSTGAQTQSIAAYSSGTYSLVQISNGCPSVPALFTVFHHPVTTASLDPIEPRCTIAGPHNLIGSPPGGNYFGPGVTGHFFLPSAANLGDNILLYISNELFGNTTCHSTATIVVSVTDCTGLEELSNSSRITVFPNPGQGSFNIHADGKKIRSIRVYDLSGKTILQQETITKDADMILELGSYADGIYLLDVKCEDSSSYIRLIKQ